MKTEIWIEKRCIHHRFDIIALNRGNIKFLWPWDIRIYNMQSKATDDMSWIWAGVFYVDCALVAKICKFNNRDIQMHYVVMRMARMNSLSRPHL